MSNVIHIMSDQNKSHSPPPIRASTPVPNNRSLLSTLTNYSLRRHHSAPQQECRWQQVHLSFSLILIEIEIVSSLFISFLSG